MDDKTHESLDFQVESFKPKEKEHEHPHGTIDDCIAFITKDIKQTAEKIDIEEGNDKLEESDNKKNSVSKATEEQVKRILAAFPENKHDQAHHFELLYKVIHAQLQVDVDKHQGEHGERHHHKKKHVEHFEELKKAYFDSFTEEKTENKK